MSCSSAPVSTVYSASTSYFGGKETKTTTITSTITPSPTVTTITTSSCVHPTASHANKRDQGIEIPDDTWEMVWSLNDEPKDENVSTKDVISHSETHIHLPVDVPETPHHHLMERSPEPRQWWRNKGRQGPPSSCRAYTTITSESTIHPTPTTTTLTETQEVDNTSSTVIDVPVETKYSEAVCDNTSSTSSETPSATPTPAPESEHPVAQSVNESSPSASESSASPTEAPETSSASPESPASTTSWQETSASPSADTTPTDSTSSNWSEHASATPTYSEWSETPSETPVAASTTEWWESTTSSSEYQWWTESSATSTEWQGASTTDSTTWSDPSSWVASTTDAGAIVAGAAITSSDSSTFQSSSTSSSASSSGLASAPTTTTSTSSGSISSAISTLSPTSASDSSPKAGESGALITASPSSAVVSSTPVPSSEATKLAGASGGPSTGSREISAAAAVGGILGSFAFIFLVLFCMRYYRRKQAEKDRLMLGQSGWFEDRRDEDQSSGQVSFAPLSDPPPNQGDRGNVFQSRFSAPSFQRQSNQGSPFTFPGFLAAPIKRLINRDHSASNGNNGPSWKRAISPPLPARDVPAWAEKYVDEPSSSGGHRVTFSQDSNIPGPSGNGSKDWEEMLDGQQKAAAIESQNKKLNWGHSYAGPHIPIPAPGPLTRPHLSPRIPVPIYDAPTTSSAERNLTGQEAGIGSVVMPKPGIKPFVVNADALPSPTTSSIYSNGESRYSQPSRKSTLRDKERDRMTLHPDDNISTRTLSTWQPGDPELRNMIINRSLAYPQSVGITRTNTTRSNISQVSDVSLPPFPLPPSGRPISMSDLNNGSYNNNFDPSQGTYVPIQPGGTPIPSGGFGLDSDSYLLPPRNLNTIGNNRSSIIDPTRNGQSNIPASSIFEYADFTVRVGRGDENRHLSQPHSTSNSIFADAIESYDQLNSNQIPLPKPKVSNGSSSTPQWQNQDRNLWIWDNQTSGNGSGPNIDKRKSIKAVKFDSPAVQNGARGSSGLWSAGGSSVDSDFMNQGVARAL